MKPDALHIVFQYLLLEKGVHHHHGRHRYIFLLLFESSRVYLQV